MTNSWTFRRRSDVQRFWREVHDVPRRTNGRKHCHEERFCLGLYLLALATHDLLTYPLHVEQGESPDFMLTWRSGEITGIEVTRATERWLQRKMTEMDREAEPSELLLSPSGWVNDEPERLFCWLVGKSVENKLDKLPDYKAASSHELLIADDLPVGANSREAFAAMGAWVRSLQPRRGCAFAKVSVIKSLDVAYDLGGDFRLLPYVEWSSPKLDDRKSARDFADRAEYAGRTAAESAVSYHKQMRNPVYSVDARGRLVKESSDGRRFEVKVTPDGNEAVVRELRD